VRAETWLRAAGVATWLVASVATAVAIARGDLGGARAVEWAVASVGFVIAFAIACARPDGERRGPLVAALVAQSLASLGMAVLAVDGMGAVTFVVVAGQLPRAVSPRVAAAWVIAQTGVFAAAMVTAGSVRWAVELTVAYLGFQAFAIATASLAAREGAARDALALANAELHATRALVADRSRDAERVRVARDLHDALGHHLTALGMQLEVASRLADGAAAEHVQQARAIGQLLLADVREVVRDLREAPEPLRATLEAIAASTRGSLAVHLALAGVDGVAPARADAIARCVQELVTNAARHAGARELWIAVACDAAGAVRVHARDDGRGAGDVRFGNGLTGMRERFEAHGGTVAARRGDAGGVEIEATMPAPRGAA
jgi:signal transduction histidine kinase